MHNVTRGKKKKKIFILRWLSSAPSSDAKERDQPSLLDQCSGGGGASPLWNISTEVEIDGDCSVFIPPLQRTIDKPLQLHFPGNDRAR